LILPAATLVMLIIGTLYSWTIFTEPLLVFFHWSLGTTTWAYAIANFSLAAVGTVLGGFWQDKAGPRPVALTGVFLWGLGNVLAGIGTSRFGAAWLYVTYGAIGGIGAGMAYIAPLAVVTKWFPDRRGFAGGMVAGGFGLGAFVYTQVVPRLPGFRTATVHAGEAAEFISKAATSPHIALGRPTSDIDAVMQVFGVSGLVFLLVGLPAAALLRNPCSRRGECFEVAHAEGIRGGYPPSVMLKMPQFYLLWLQLFANALAGISIISNAVPLIADLTMLPTASIAPAFGILSIFNTVGRLFWGAISDRIGCNNTFVSMYAVQAAALLVLAQVHILSLSLAAISVVLLCCGGGFGTMPAYCAEYFGMRYMGLNYGLVLSAWGFAGLIGPTLLARAKDLGGSFEAAMHAIALVLTVALILPFLTRKPSPARVLHP
jgi:MFS transporter, OFA family, oxalate/formate antiporter